MNKDIDTQLGNILRPFSTQTDSKAVTLVWGSTDLIAEAKASLKQLLIRERIDELGKYQDWLNSEGRIWSERKRFYEDRIAALEAKLKGDS